jgi:hypothetical protein
MPRATAMKRWVTTMLVVGLWGPAAPAQDRAVPPLQFTRPPAPLFSSHAVLRVTIEGPLKRIFEERDEEEKESYEGVLRHHAVGIDEAFDVELRTRGHYRLRPTTCEFPPIRVNFKRSQVEGTVFAGQNKIKMVTHCQDGSDEYEQYVLQEYLVYRMFAALTDSSFQVRLARVTYVDTEGERDSLTRFAFFIEDEDAMAERNGWDVLEVPQVLPAQMQQQPLVLVELFEFMIGNTDWDAFYGERGGACCHNTALIGSFRDFVVIPVPYDFDFCGLIWTRYAEPNPRLPIRNVRQRLYRGICRPREEIEAVFPLFEERREMLYGLVRSLPGLAPDRIAGTIEYLDGFYETIRDPRKVEREILRRCRPVEG